MSSHTERVPPVAPLRRRACRAARVTPLIALCVLVAGCSAGARGARPPEEPPISIVAVQLTAAGHYVDLRYRVIDAERAQLALGPKIRPKLINESNGAEMAVPTTAKLGSLRQTQAVQEPGRTYFVMFINSGAVQTGSRVTAELGELKFEHLLVD